MRGYIEPEAAFQGTLLFLAPHMDDEVLACGATIAQLPDHGRIHIAYATDGARSPVPTFAWSARASADLPAIRRAEAKSALSVLGIPERNAHYLNFPDAALQKSLPALTLALLNLLERVRPSCVFIPFRYDRHPDHLALHAAARQASTLFNPGVQLIEYFVYYRWRLLPGGDVRTLIAPEHLVIVDVRDKGHQKRCALECYASQTTRFFRWQDRPILPPERVAEVSCAPEWFLRTDPAHPAATVFDRMKPWIPVAHRLEPVLKKAKDTVGELTRRPLRDLCGRTRSSCRIDV